jgi:hypothetical protein
MFWKRSAEEKPLKSASLSVPSGPRTPRQSSGWGSILAFLKENEAPVVMDVGATSSSNVNLLTSLGCSIFLPDPLHDLSTSRWQEALKSDKPDEVAEAVRSFMEESFSFSGREFDCVLLWDTLDYLPEPLLQPMIDRIYSVMKPGGKVLSYYRSKLESGTAVHRRFHGTDSNVVESQTGARYPQLQVLQNRSVERLFHDFASSRFLVAGDNLREVVFTR